MKVFTGLSLALCLAGCGADGGGEPLAEATANNAIAAAEQVEPSASKASATPSCLFKETGNWRGSIEGGRLLVTGTVDVQMAGMKPQLTPRPRASSGAMAFDLALVPAAGEPVTDQVRHEQSGVAAARTGEIYCGDKRIASFDMVVI